MDFVPFVFAASTTLFLTVNYKKLLRSTPLTEERALIKKEPKRSELPDNVHDWRAILDLDDETTNPMRDTWYILKDWFEEKYGVFLWDNYATTGQEPRLTDPRLPKPNGYNTLTHCNLDKALSRWPYWCPRNGTQHVARTAAGCDVMIRVMSSGGTGENYRDILRYLNQAPDILLSTNHVLPMLEEMIFEDISFGVFPRLDASLIEAFDTFFDNSVEDALYMIMEALEGIEYLHKHHIAHQDLFLANFVIQWQPQSLVKRAMARPRVWVIDFEDSVMFPKEMNPADMKVAKFPRVLEECARPLAPEVYKPEPYCPFKLDIWQFGTDLIPFDPSFAEVTEIFEDMRKDLPEDRITAGEALRRLDEFVRSQPPVNLHIPFVAWV